MTREQLINVVVNINVKCGRNAEAAREVATEDLPGALRMAAALIFTYNLEVGTEAQIIRQQFKQLLEHGMLNLT